MINSTIRSTISKLLIDLGVYPHLSGYHYLVDAIEIKVKLPFADIMKGVYEPVAFKHDITAKNVERPMRHAILLASQYRTDAYQKIFGDMKFGKTGRPNNNIFISTIAEYVRRRGDNVSVG